MEKKQVTHKEDLAIPSVIIDACVSFPQCMECARAVIKSCDSKDCINCSKTAVEEPSTTSVNVIPQPSCKSLNICGDCRGTQSESSFAADSKCDSIDICQDCLCSKSKTEVKEPKICESVSFCENCRSPKKEVRFQHLINHLKSKNEK